MNREELIDFMARKGAPQIFEWLDERPDIPEYQELAQEHRGYMAAALDALSAAGLAVVSKEPTDEMVEACADQLDVVDGMFVVNKPDGLQAAIAEGDILRKED